MIQKYEGPIEIVDQPGLLHQARVLEAFHNLAILEPEVFYATFADMTSDYSGGKIPGYPQDRAVSINERTIGSFVPFVAKVSDNVTEMYGELHVGDGNNPNERLNLQNSLQEPRVPEVGVFYPAYIRAHSVEGTSGVLYVATANEAGETKIPEDDLHILSFSEDMEQLYRNTRVPEETTAFDLMSKAFADLSQFVR